MDVIPTLQRISGMIEGCMDQVPRDSNPMPGPMTTQGKQVLLPTSAIVLTQTYYPGPSQTERLLRVTSAIAAELITAHDTNRSVSLNEIRSRLSKKFGYSGQPRLVDIISAVPDDYKKALLPKLKARPIRTASGVCCIFEFNSKIIH